MKVSTHKIVRHANVFNLLAEIGYMRKRLDNSDAQPPMVHKHTLDAKNLNDYRVFPIITHYTLGEVKIVRSPTRLYGTIPTIKRNSFASFCQYL